MKPILDLKDHTITDFTPTDLVSRFLKRLGFRCLDHTAFVLPPLSRNERFHRAVACDLVDMGEQDATELNAADLQIHRDIHCGHMLVHGPRSYCYIVYSRIERHWLPYCFVHYVSDKQLFVEHHAAIRSHLMQNTGGRYVVVDARLLTDVKVPCAFARRKSCIGQPTWLCTKSTACIRRWSSSSCPHCFPCNNACARRRCVAFRAACAGR